MLTKRTQEVKLLDEHINANKEIITNKHTESSKLGENFAEEQMTAAANPEPELTDVAQPKEPKIEAESVSNYNAEEVQAETIVEEAKIEEPIAEANNDEHFVEAKIGEPIVEAKTDELIVEAKNEETLEAKTEPNNEELQKAVEKPYAQA